MFRLVILSVALQCAFGLWIQSPLVTDSSVITVDGRILSVESPIITHDLVTKTKLESIVDTTGLRCAGVGCLGIKTVAIDKFEDDACLKKWGINCITLAKMTPDELCVKTGMGCVKKVPILGLDKWDKRVLPIVEVN